MRPQGEACCSDESSPLKQPGSGLRLLPRLKLEAADFRNSLNQECDLRAEFLIELFHRYLCIFDYVVQKARGHSCCIEVECGQFKSNGHRVGEEYLARASLLFSVGLLAEPVDMGNVVEVHPAVRLTDILQPFIQEGR